MESGVRQSFEWRGGYALCQQIRQNAAGADQGDQPVQTELLVPEQFLRSPLRRSEIQVEVGAAQEHEDGGDPDQIRIAGEMPHTVVVIGEASGAYGAEGQDQCIQQLHAAQHIEQRLDAGKRQIEGIQILRCIGIMGRQLVHGRSRCFRTGDDLSADSHTWHQCCGEDDDAHSADPVGEGTPEQHGVRQRLDVHQNRGPGGGISGAHLEERIHVAWNGSGYPEGNRTDQRNQNPGEGDDQISFPFLRPDAGGGEEFHEQQSPHQTEPQGT